MKDLLSLSNSKKTLAQQNDLNKFVKHKLLIFLKKFSKNKSTDEQVKT